MRYWEHSMSESKNISQGGKMQKCRQCGAMFRGHFCRVCGAKSEEYVSFCPVCGQDREGDDLFCGNCGFSFGGEARATVAVEMPEESRRAPEKAEDVPAPSTVREVREIETEEKPMVERDDYEPPTYDENTGQMSLF